MNKKYIIYGLLMISEFFVTGCCIATVPKSFKFAPMVKAPVSAKRTVAPARMIVPGPEKKSYRNVGIALAAGVGAGYVLFTPISHKEDAQDNTAYYGITNQEILWCMGTAVSLFVLGVVVAKGIQESPRQ